MMACIPFFVLFRNAALINRKEYLKLQNEEKTLEGKAVSSQMTGG